MDIWSASPVDARALFRDERSELVAFLDALSLQDWEAPSRAGDWTVKDLALHLLDGDLGRLSRERDGDLTGQLHIGTEDSLVDALAAKNEKWLRAARQFSPRVIRDLLLYSSQQVEDWTANADLFGPAHVSWASDEPVPAWLDHAREFTETWVHHQQIREATGQRPDHTRLAAVLGTFVWAFQYQYRVSAPAGESVGIDLDLGGQWHLVSQGASRWSLEPGPASPPSALMRFTSEGAWRSLTGALVPQDGIWSTGPERLTRPLLDVRGIIA